jgi:hypothetical protein
MSPFDAFDEHEAALLDQDAYLQLHRPPPPLRRYRRRLPAGLVALIEACLRQQPEERPTAAQIWQALQNVLAEIEPPETDDEDDDSTPAFG